MSPDQAKAADLQPVGSPDDDTRMGIVAGLFAEAFGVSSVAVDDDFFHLGGDSLIAATLMTAIEQRFARVLSISVLLEAPTPRALARRITTSVRTERALRSILPIKTDGVPPTIFCVHGTDGESMLPPQLAAALGNRPVYAYRAIGLEENEHALTSIEAIARDYIEAIDAVAPKGPILILGHCDGSLIAYEMARQLASQGRPPRGLVMVDPSADSHRAPQLHDSGLTLLLKRSRLRTISDTLRGQFGAAADKVSGAERREMVRLALNVAASQYEVKRYEGPVLFFYTPERKLRLLDPRTGFPAHIPNLYVVELFVEHQQMFKRELPRIAAEVNAFIARLGM